MTRPYIRLLSLALFLNLFILLPPPLSAAPVPVVRATANHTAAASPDRPVQPPLSTVNENPGAQKVRDFTAADATVSEPEIFAIYNELFRITYEAAPDIRIARASHRQKSRQRYTAWARRIAPAIDARLSRIHEFNMEDDPTTDTSSSTTPGQTVVPASPAYSDGEDYSDWSFNMNLPVYRRSVSLKVDIATADEQLAANNLAIRTRELDLRLRELFNKYLTASYRYCNIRNSVRLSREHVSKIERGYELRDQTRLQLLRAQANLNELEARHDLDRQRREAAFRELLDFTGLQGNEPLFARLRDLLGSEVGIAGAINSLADIGKGYERIKKFIEVPDDEVLRRYFAAHSLLYQKIILEQKLADTRAKVFTQEEWPELAVRGLYSRKEDTRFESGDGEGSLALVFSVPLFSGGTIFSTSESQAMARRIAEVTRSTNLKKTIHSIENNRAMIRSLRKVYATQQVHLRQQQEIVILSLKSYKIKQTSMQDLLTSKNRLIDAKDALMETTGRLGILYRQFAWQIGSPYPSPAVEKTAPQDNTP